MPDAGYEKRRSEWTMQAMIDAALEWERIFGEPPAAGDWHPGDSELACRRSVERAAWWAERAARFSVGEFPWTGSVSKQFGTWNDFMRATGFGERLPGRRRSSGELSPVHLTDTQVREITANLMLLAKVMQP